MSSTSSQHNSEKKNFQIEISQDGKFAITFDTANHRFKIYKNSDYRSFTNSKNDEAKNDNEQDATFADFSELDSPINENQTFFNRLQEGDDIINEIIVNFEIDDKFNSLKIYNDPHYQSNQNFSNNDQYRWSFNISSLQTYGNEKFIFVAISYIDVEMDMKGKKGEPTNVENDMNGPTENYYKMNMSNDSLVHKRDSLYIEYLLIAEKKIFDFGSQGKTIILCFKLNESNESYSLANRDYPLNYHHYCGDISGIPRFINEQGDINKQDDIINNQNLKRFILLNFNGIYNYEYNNENLSFNYSEKFDYPKSMKDELNYWHTGNLTDCMNRLLACLYNNYLLVEKYKNKVQVLEVCNLAEMKFETEAKIVKNKDKHIKKYNKNNFTISKNKLQLCYTRGLHSIKLYLVENGLQIAAKNFEGDIEKIHLLEFIYNDEMLLIIGDDKEQRQRAIIWNLYNTDKVESIPLEDLDTCLARTSGNLLHVDDKGNVRSILKNIEIKKEKEKKKIPVKEKKGIILYENGLENYKKFCIVADGKEPWVTDRYESYSFCLDHNDEKTVELIVGKSTVQIWHKIHHKKNCPNKGEPFLEYIWTNGVPIDQEYDDAYNGLHIEKIEFGHEHLRLKVYWDEKNEKGNLKRKKRIIQWNDIVEKVNAIRSACKALEHLNKRRRYLSNNFSKVHCYDEMVMYINHMIWRFINNSPDQFRLLDVRHNVMKNLILGDCDHLIKFILFGNDENCPANDKSCNNGIKEKFVIKHIPRNVYWKKERNFVQDDDLRPFEEPTNESEPRKIEPTNDLELAIYHCKGRELKDTMIVAYLLEYYTRHAIEYAGWMTTVSRALPFLYKYHYVDYAKKLFRKECFADQDHFSAQDPYDIIPNGFRSGYFREKVFIAFRPVDKLQSDKVSKLDSFTQQMIDNFKKMKNKLVKFFDKDYEKSPIALRVVPLPGFTIHKIKKVKKENNDKTAEFGFIKILLKILWLLFIPRWYQIRHSDINKLSPFARVIRYEDNDDMYDNPATEAVIDFRWRNARTFFILLFLRFIIFAFCFIFVSNAYITHNVTEEKYNTFLLVLIGLFYYLAVYLMATEIIQCFHHGFKKYFSEVFNYFDLLSIIIPTIVMSYIFVDFQHSDGFGNVNIV
ncbi:hypothetical protein C1645_879508 [Glomus cerebriforme]|uniref:Ion transport domain-containing protein n=1 Tax=Glomus cerebriforme TaxID=658196 RepID=A0A397SME8_9GLOM|nr:hypothetical protein C1645_879508 [Glomus cerebriforme]